MRKLIDYRVLSYKDYTGGDKEEKTLKEQVLELTAKGWELGGYSVNSEGGQFWYRVYYQVMLKYENV